MRPQAGRLNAWRDQREVKLRRGRSPTTPRVQKRDVCDLIETTSEGLATFIGSMLHFLHYIGLEFGLSPRQYLNWVKKFLCLGKYMMRSCFLCGELFASLDSATGIAPGAGPIGAGFYGTMASRFLPVSKLNNSLPLN